MRQLLRATFFCALFLGIGQIVSFSPLHAAEEEEDFSEDLSLWGDLANAISSEKVAAEKREEGSSIRAKFGVQHKRKNLLEVELIEMGKRRYPFARARVRVLEVVAPGRKVKGIEAGHELDVTLFVDTEEATSRELFEQLSSQQRIVGELAKKSKGGVTKYGMRVLSFAGLPAVGTPPSHPTTSPETPETQASPQNPTGDSPPTSPDTPPAETTPPAPE
ncbi:MAG: hypothetical protein D6795_15660 [Deltaproteobacteria bacterium]|nr:MAG: hypothetical protein D6795_15660 [Deltaproteobacteria bacterium]